MKLKKLLYLLFILPFMVSCNDDDDIGEIFCSGTWNVGNFYASADWGEYNDKGRPAYTKPEEIKLLNNISIVFEGDGTFTGKTPTGGFSGMWEANGKDRSVNITQMKTNGTQTHYSEKVIEYLKNARWYKGDSNYLKIAPEDTHTYMQLGHYSD